MGVFLLWYFHINAQNMLTSRLKHCQLSGRGISFYMQMMISVNHD